MKESEGGSGVRIFPSVVLTVALGVTLLQGFVYHIVTLGRDRLRLENAVQAVEDRIRERFDTYVERLLATRAFLATAGRLDAAGFHQFVSEMAPRERFSGIQGIGITRRVPWGQRARFEAEMRGMGLSDLRIWPDTSREEGNVIVLLHPLDRRNQVAIGYDMSTEPVRREAMARARDTGEPAASGPVTLIQEIDQVKQEGFLIYVPIYEGVSTPDDVEERRKGLLGFVYSSLRVGDLLSGIFMSEREPRVAFTICDRNGSGPVELYRSAGFTGSGRLSTEVDLDIAGRTWSLMFETLPFFDQSSGVWLTPYVYAVGAAVSVLLYLLALRQWQTEEQLRLHSRVLEKMSEGMSVSDQRGFILYTNPAEDRMFGYPPGELIGKHVTVLNAYPPSENERIVEEVIRALTDSGVWSGEFSNIRKDGAPFVTSARISALDIKGQRCWVCVQEDITERKRAEREREELLDRETAARAAAEEANRIKDEFLAMLGHELRNPLAPIVTALDILRLRGQGQEPTFAVIERQVRHLRRLVDDLLDMARIARGRVTLDRRRLALACIVEDAVELARPLVEQRRHTLVIDVPAGLLVDADRGRLAQAFANLLGNAAKYTDPGGRIAVAAEARGGEVILVVRDNGMGIPPHLLSKIFELFTQGPRSLDRAQGGLGIGLAIARNLVELHAGRIEAHSEGQGQGSEFEVHLPAANEAVESAGEG